MTAKEPLGSSTPETASSNDDVRLDRAWAVMRYFTGPVGLSKDRFNVTASRPLLPARLAGHRVVAVTLIAGNVY